MENGWKQTEKGRIGEEWRKGNMAIVVFYRPDLKLATFWEGQRIEFEKQVETKEQILKVAKNWRKNY